MQDVLPLVIVGCGPAGLAAASVLASRAPRLSWLAIEAGRALDQRRRGDPHDIMAGVGGAGLYSDGKFSFHPAATELWRLEDSPRLQRAYDWVLSLLSEERITAPTFPVLPGTALESPWKPYPSLCLDLPSRWRLIERLYAPLGEQVWLGTRLLDLERLPDGILQLLVERQGERISLRTKALLCAGGRFFPLRFAQCSGGDMPMRFQRWEVGLRIEGATTHPFFEELRATCSPDPKLILRVKGRPLEWRTFCCCIDGEVIESNCDDFSTLSGRADGAPTGRSNIGFNVRFLDGAADMLDLTRLQGRRPFRVPLVEAIEDSVVLDDVYGALPAEALREGLSRLGGVFASLLESADQLTAAGPTLEGVGYYPRTTSCLAMEGWPIYFAGDACGKFRGLVAALVSGAYTGEAIASELAKEPTPTGAGRVG